MQDTAIVEPRPGSDPPTGQDAESSSAAELEPCHCVLLRAGGQMSVLDMAQGGLALLCFAWLCFALLCFALWHVAMTAGKQRFSLHAMSQPALSVATHNTARQLMGWGPWTVQTAFALES